MHGLVLEQEFCFYSNCIYSSILQAKELFYLDNSTVASTAKNQNMQQRVENDFGAIQISSQQHLAHFGKGICFFKNRVHARWRAFQGVEALKRRKNGIWGLRIPQSGLIHVHVQRLVPDSITLATPREYLIILLISTWALCARSSPGTRFYNFSYP